MVPIAKSAKSHMLNECSADSQMRNANCHAPFISPKFHTKSGKQKRLMPMSKTKTPNQTPKHQHQRHLHLYILSYLGLLDVQRYSLLLQQVFQPHFQRFPPSFASDAWSGRVAPTPLQFLSDRSQRREIDAAQLGQLQSKSCELSAHCCGDRFLIFSLPNQSHKSVYAFFSFTPIHGSGCC